MRVDVCRPALTFAWSRRFTGPDRSFPVDETNHSVDFLAGSGEMGSLVKNFP